MLSEMKHQTARTFTSSAAAHTFLRMGRSPGDETGQCWRSCCVQPPPCRDQVLLQLGFLSEEAFVERRHHVPVGKRRHGPGACRFCGGADGCPMSAGVGTQVCMVSPWHASGGSTGCHMAVAGPCLSSGGHQGPAGGNGASCLAAPPLFWGDWLAGPPCTQGYSVPSAALSTVSCPMITTPCLAGWARPLQVYVEVSGSPKKSH